jgi:hypothetical protein
MLVIPATSGVSCFKAGLGKKEDLISADKLGIIPATWITC